VAKREDGKETRLRVLNAACEIFAQKGYRDARVADICGRAGANVASVNYYFGGKASLYQEAWRQALEDFQQRVILDVEAVLPKEALRQYIQALIRLFSAKGESADFSRLYLMELLNPTGLIEDAWREMMETRRQRLQQIIRRIMGPGAKELAVRFCEQSIINQCRVLLTIKRSDLEYMLEERLTPDLIRRLADHIADFSLAGIEAVGKR